MVIKLRNDVFFSDPESRVREYCAIEVYEGYDDKHTPDNILTQTDIESANKLYAMIDKYDKNESRRILDQSQAISILLDKLPKKAIYDYKEEEWSALKPRIEALFKKMTSIYQVGIDKSIKILHLKRPELFPVLDNYVVQFLTGKMPSSSNRDIALAIKCLDITRETVNTQIIEFTDLQRRLTDLPYYLSIVRIFDILCWSTHKWDILGKTTAPKGRAYISLIKIQKNGAKPVSVKGSKIIPKKGIIKNSNSSTTSRIVIDFFNDLGSQAKYGIKGEKPIAVLAILQYLKNTKQIGVKFLDLLDYPYYEKVRVNFIELAEKYGSYANPSSSWIIITGINMELQRDITDNAKVNQAVADLSLSEIEKTYNYLLEKIQ